MPLIEDFSLGNSKFILSAALTKMRVIGRKHKYAFKYLLKVKK